MSGGIQIAQCRKSAVPPRFIFHNVYRNLSSSGDKFSAQVLSKSSPHYFFNSYEEKKRAVPEISLEA